MKRFFKPIKKYDGSDIYLFIGGIARVPGVFFRHKPMTITLKEFNELRAQGAKPMKHKIFVAHQGDIVQSKKTNKLMQVHEVILKGREATNKRKGTRAHVSAFRIMENGQVLRNSTVCLDKQWTHYRGPELCLH